MFDRIAILGFRKERDMMDSTPFISFMECFLAVIIDGFKSRSIRQAEILL